MSYCRCPRCNKNYMSEYDVCPFCGYVVSIDMFGKRLPENYVLKKRYIIKEYRERAGSDFVYLGIDTENDINVIIREFCPGEGLRRRADGFIGVKDDLSDTEVMERIDYRKKEFRFYDRYQNFAYRRPHLLSPIDWFEENGNIYKVIQFFPFKCKTLNEYVKELGKVPYEDLFSILLPVFIEVYFMHTQGVLHGELVPHNIKVVGSKTGFLELSDAEMEINEPGKNIFLSPHYSALEEYYAKKEKKEYSNVYSCAAIVYYALTGKAPENPLERLDGSVGLEKPSRLGADIPEDAEKSLMEALAIQPEDRVDSMITFINGVFPKKYNRVYPEVYFYKFSIPVEKKYSRGIGMLNEAIRAYKSEKSSIDWNRIMFKTEINCYSLIPAYQYEVKDFFGYLTGRLGDIEPHAYGFEDVLYYSFMGSPHRDIKTEVVI